MPLAQVVFVTGRWRTAASVVLLLRQFPGEDGPSPILLAHDPTRVLIGALASPARRSPDRPSVLHEIESAISDIEVLRETLVDLKSVVDLQFQVPEAQYGEPGLPPA